MAKNPTSRQDMYSRLMGARLETADSEADAKVKNTKTRPQRESKPALKQSNPKKLQQKAAESGAKRLNLNISIQQWRKLKSYAMDRGISASDVIRDYIDAL